MLYGYDDKANMPLSDQEIRNLLKKYRMGDKDAYQKIVFSNICLIKYIIGLKFKHYYYDKEELYASGKYGLLNAIENFSFDRNVKFVTYAVRCIYNEMLSFAKKEIRNKGAIVSIENYLKDSDYDLWDDIDDDLFEHEKFFVDESVTFEDDICHQELIKYIPIIVDEIPNKIYKDIFKSYFGFSETFASKKDLASQYNLSIYKITKIIFECLKYVIYRLEELGLIELSNEEKQFERKRAKSLTEFFDCQEGELLNLFSNLTPQEQELLMYRNGRDLKSYNQGKFTNRNLEKKYYHLTCKCRRLIKLARFTEENNKEDNKEDNKDETRSFMEAEGIVLTKVPIRKK